jgi:hypothetical protein
VGVASDFVHAEGKRMKGNQMCYECVSHETQDSNKESWELKTLKTGYLKSSSVIMILNILAKVGVTWSTKEDTLHSC